MFTLGRKRLLERQSVAYKSTKFESGRRFWDIKLGLASGQAACSWTTTRGGEHTRGKDIASGGCNRMGPRENRSRASPSSLRKPKFQAYLTRRETRR